MRNKQFLTIVFLFLLALLVSACGNAESSAESPVGPQNQVAYGAELFAKPVLESQTGCGTCHSLYEGETIVGPSMFGIASRASERESGLSAEEYIRQSILDPDAFLVEDYPPGNMPKTWADKLSDEKLNALVAYLLTLE